MTTRTTAQILQSSITNLGWLNVTPHRTDQVIGLHAEATRTRPQARHFSLDRYGLTPEPANRTPAAVLRGVLGT